LRVCETAVECQFAEVDLNMDKFPMINKLWLFAISESKFCKTESPLLTNILTI
jgi:hypothetical protein